MVEEEKIRKLAELREILEERVKSLEAEIEGLKSLLEIVNSILLERSFRRAEEIVHPAPSKPPEAAPAPPTPPIKEPAKVIPLRSGAGELLANIYVEDRNMRIIPEADKKFDMSIPPFEAFLVDKVLVKMRDADQEAVRRGELMPEEALSFDVKADGKIIREVLIRNVNPQRERELRSAIRWTLEKMYEKAKGS
jgi:hypothetical protein